MTDLSAELSPGKTKPIRTAVYQNKAASRAGISERLFALVFSGLVYPQIWEDPEIDMEAMELNEGHSIVTIASGGCNLLAYLSRSPASIDAVDLNKAHIALNRLKLTAFRYLPSHGDVFRFFGEAGNRHNSAAYDHFIAPNLDPSSRRYWEKRNWRGKRRISAFENNFYRKGALGFFIGVGHRAARLYGGQRRRHHEGDQPVRAAPLLRGGAGADLREAADPPRDLAEIFALRARHPAGAI
jgi:S-adenosylmethionine-diacylglycerol 3-amino-3-carboxypropyl transferase